MARMVCCDRCDRLDPTTGPDEKRWQGQQIVATDGWEAELCALCMALLKTWVEEGVK